jgi:hypothetical protein
MLKMVKGLNAFLEYEWIDEIHVFKYFYNYMHVIFQSTILRGCSYICNTVHY